MNLSLSTTSETIRTAGDIVTGSVSLNIPVLRLRHIKEVHVNLSAKVVTTINNHREEIILAHKCIGIWHDLPVKGNVDNDIHVQEVPFSITLPRISLPSQRYGKEDMVHNWPAYSACYVSATATHEKPASNATQIRAITYLPTNARGAELSRILTEGWTGGWRTFEESKTLRDGLPLTALLRPQIHVIVSLSLPDIEVFPVYTAIPYKLTVTASTTTEAQPTKMLDLDLTLERDVRMMAHSKQKTLPREFVKRLGCCGALAEKYPDSRLDVQKGPWLPHYDDDKRPTGLWRQEHYVESTFTLRSAPSFESRTLNVKNFMQIAVASSGKSTDTIALIPLEFVSNLDEVVSSEG